MLRLERSPNSISGIPRKSQYFQNIVIFVIVAKPNLALVVQILMNSALAEE